MQQNVSQIQKPGCIKLLGQILTACRYQEWGSAASARSASVRAQHKQGVQSRTVGVGSQCESLSSTQDSYPSPLPEPPAQASPALARNPTNKACPLLGQMVRVGKFVWCGLYQIRLSQGAFLSALLLYIETQNKIYQ